MTGLIVIKKRYTMTKRIAVINDLSGFGRCSLTAAIPVISVMGAQPCPLPTAVLSAQTGFSSYYFDDYTEKMEYFRQEWEKMGACFDGIYTGFMGSDAQIQQVFCFLDTFYKEDTVLLVDPIMGDEGTRFSFCTDTLLCDMKALAARADVVTPNLMELCLLTDSDYKEIIRIAREKEGPADSVLDKPENGDLNFCRNKEHLIKEIERLAGELLAQGVKTVIVTGIRFFDEKEDQMKIGNLTVTKQRTELSAFPYIGGSFSGTGDLFASVVAGGIIRNDDIFQTVELAGAFIGAATSDSAKERVSRNEGANFEKYLGMLLK